MVTTTNAWLPGDNGYSPNYGTAMGDKGCSANYHTTIGDKGSGANYNTTIEIWEVFDARPKQWKNWSASWKEARPSK